MVMTRTLRGLVLLGLVAVSTGCESQAKGSKKEEAAVVVVAKAELRDVPREVETFGTVEASSTVDVAPQVQGLVTEVHFKEGDFVKRGDLLFTIDTRPYRASLAAAQADLQRSRALAEQANREADRAARLRLEGIASDQELAQAQAAAASNAANVSASQAQIQSATLNVTFTRITAPIDGRTGALLVHAGNVVRPGDAQPLVVIRSLTPVQVRFAVPQEHLTAIREKLGKEPIEVKATPRGVGTKTAMGLLTFLESTVDVATGTVALKATFTNAGLELWPGAAVDVVLALGTDKQALVVPEAALQRSQSGMTVFVIGKDDRAEPRSVEVLRTAKTQVLLRSGVTADEEVVTDGQLRLRKGSKVSRKAAAPSPTASVSPEQKRPEGL
jgi:multidrug efflux system membrane fusion protein